MWDPEKLAKELEGSVTRCVPGAWMGDGQVGGAGGTVCREAYTCVQVCLCESTRVGEGGQGGRLGHSHGLPLSLALC